MAMTAVPSTLLPRSVLFEYYKELPTAKQHAALLLREFREVAFGGQVGGGKSEFLIQDALQYVDIPGYSALIIRKKYTDLAQPGALIDRSHKILGRNKSLHWNGDLKKWTFPSGASISFGHLSHDKDLDKYQGGEFQFIGFDEATQLYPNQIMYLFSRLRRTTGLDVPLRIRLASNPGGPSHAWFKERYVDLGGPLYESGGRIFIPSGLRDNPHLSQEEYIENLQHMDPVTRKRLLEGDWNIAAVTGIFNRNWFPIISQFEVPVMHHTIRAWDLASTAPNDQNRDPDYTATIKMGFDYVNKITYLLDFQHWRLTPHESEARMRNIVQADGIKALHIVELEPGSSGKALLSHLQRNVVPGYRIKGMKPQGSKVTRSGPVSSAAENGTIYVVEQPHKLMDEFFTELELFPTKGIHDDWVDALSLCYSHVTKPKAPLMV